MTLIQKKYIDFKAARRMDRFSQFAVKASMDAVSDSGLVIDERNAHRIGVMIGSGVGGIETFEKQHTILLERGGNRVSPFLIPMMIPNMAAAHVSIASGQKALFRQLLQRVRQVRMLSVMLLK